MFGGQAVFRYSRLGTNRKRDAMADRKFAPTRDRRDVGKVVFLMEKMALSRELSSCCIGVEANLETQAGSATLETYLARLENSKKVRD